MLSKRRILSGTYVVLSVLATIPLMGSSGGCDNNNKTFNCVGTTSNGPLSFGEFPNDVGGHLACEQAKLAAQAQNAVKKLGQSQSNSY